MDKNDSSSNGKQSIGFKGFKFTKTTSKTLIGNRLDEISSQSKDYVTSVDETEIKSTIIREKTKELVIPLIKRNNWRVPKAPENGLTDKESKIKELAIQELLKETSEQNAMWENRESPQLPVSIPLIMQNKIPEGFETDDRMDVSLRAEESKLEDYEKVPIEQYGLAMLRGMGWKDGEGIGADNSKIVAPVQVQLRPKGLGLGADATVLKKTSKKEKEEKLELVKDSYVNITQGPHKGFYGQVLGLDEENGRAIVKIAGEDKIVTFPEFYINVVNKKEFDKESKIINRASYEKYNREKEHKEKHEQSSKKESEKKERSSKDDKRYLDNSDERNSRKYEKYSKKRRHSRERSSEEKHSSSHESKRNKLWIRPQLRVRFIDDKYKKGKYFNKKLIVVDVLSSKSCSCKTEDNTYLDDVSPSMLETVVPRSETAYVMIVQGKYTGELCTILKRDKTKCLATVQFLSDRNQALKIEYDSICEYVGDVAQFD